MSDEYRARYEALMEGLGIDPSPEVFDEYTPGRLKAEAYGIRMSEERLAEQRDELSESLRETLEALTWLIKNAPGNYWISWARTAELEARVERAQASLTKAGQP